MSGVKYCGFLAQAAPKLSRDLWADGKGVTSLEYALLTSVLAVAVLTGGATVSAALQKSFSAVSQSLGSTIALYANSPDACRPIVQESVARQDGRSAHTRVTP